jgi:hypothetical protein
MGFLDKLKKKPESAHMERKEEEGHHSHESHHHQPKKIVRYTSDGKPVNK